MSSAGIAPEDVAGGIYDGASNETWLVNWQEPQARLLLDVATIGEIRRSGAAFVAELRGLMHRLEAEQGCLHRATCDAELGDARCRLDLEDPRFRSQGSVLAVTGPTRLRARLGAAFASGWFADGRLTWTEERHCRARRRHLRP